MKPTKFKKSIDGAQEYYESIELYEDRLILRNKFEESVGMDYIDKGDREIKFYKWLRDNILKNKRNEKD